MRLIAPCAAVAALSVVVFSSSPSARAAGKRPARLTVMTQNLYLGAELTPVIQALAADPSSAPVAVAAAWADVQATDYPTRAKKLAEEIAAAKPDVVALQEAVLWRSQPVSDILTGTVAPNASHVELDFVKILQKELKKRHRSYRVASSVVDSDVEAPWLDGDVVGDLRLTDRDVVLVRSGVKASKAQTGNYEASAALPILGGIPVIRSYVALDVKVGKKKFHVVATHLEDLAEQVRAAQALELIAGPAASALPTVVLGDFNTDAALASPEPTYLTLVGALTEAWPALHPGVPGLTWGQQPLLDNAASTATQRLDLVLFHGALTATSIEIVGEDPTDKINGLWPSDHAGVVAKFELQ